MAVLVVYKRTWLVASLLSLLDSNCGAVASIHRKSSELLLVGCRGRSLPGVAMVHVGLAAGREAIAEGK